MVKNITLILLAAVATCSILLNSWQWSEKNTLVFEIWYAESKIEKLEKDLSLARVAYKIAEHGNAPRAGQACSDAIAVCKMAFEEIEVSLRAAKEEVESQGCQAIAIQKILARRTAHERSFIPDN